MTAANRIDLVVDEQHNMMESWQRRGEINLETRGKIEWHRHNTNFGFLDFKPGFWVYRTWEGNDVIRLDDQGCLEAHLIQALAIPLGTWGEHL